MLEMTTPRPSFGEALKVWFKIGCLSFGGPAGQIALMHRVVVDEKKWLPEPQFLHALNFCMLLPGPEATELATYAGWLLHGVRGARTIINDYASGDLRRLLIWLLAAITVVWLLLGLLVVVAFDPNTGVSVGPFS